MSPVFVPAPLAGILINKFSSRVSIVVGGVLGSTGLACSAFCRTLDGVIVTAGVFLGIFVTRGASSEYSQSMF